MSKKHFPAAVLVSIASKTAKGYGDGVEKGAVAQAKKVGRMHGAAIVKWLNRLVVTGALGGAGYGSFVGLANLIAQYPRRVPVAGARAEVH
jgi:hypothetical protein